MATFVLVHGSWHGAWCWHRLRPALTALGHRVLASDLPGHGDDPMPAAKVTLRDCAEAVGRAVEAAGEPVVLVGHSFGGIVITQAAEMVPDRLARLVYLSAYLPGNGDSLSRLAAAEKDNPVSTRLVRTPDGDALLLDRSTVTQLFYADCPEEDVTLALSRLRAEPVTPLVTPVAITGARAGRVPRAYIECLRDLAIPLWLQRQMQAARPCSPVLSLPTGHSPFFAAPGALAALLDGLATAES
jgi:pimeloyl-ACP methyl ester carboxylesterase